MNAHCLVKCFLENTAENDKWFPSHISLFTAMLYFNDSLIPNIPFRICRRELMKFSRIKSNATYHKCLGDLIDGGFLNYEPSFDSRKASTLTIRCDRKNIETLNK